MFVVTLWHGGGVGIVLGVAVRRRRRGRLWLLRRRAASGAEAPGLKRELDARALFSVAYGEIASSIYFALGVLAANALGFTPLVLLAAACSS